MNFVARFGCRIVVLACSLVAMVTSASANEFRGLWVDAWGNGFFTASQVTSLVNACRTYNYNAVIVQMRRRGDAFYFPQAPNGDPRTTAIASNYDALQELINQCHSGTPRIEVHCWVTTHLIWSDQANPPSQAGHVFNLHPEYLMKNSAGATYIGEGYYLDPGHPDATLWNYNMARDIISRYDVDGFHWDYIRYPAQDSGFNATAVARYNAEFSLTGQPTAGDPQFATWRRRQVTDFLRWCNADLLELKPNLVISAAVFGSRTDAYDNRFQDWAAWNNEGIIDICMPMGYTSDNALFQSRVNDAYNHQGVRRVYMGQGAYLNTKENSVVQLNYIRNKPLPGSVFYSYRVPNSGTVDQTGTFTYVKNNYQPAWTDTPAIPWKATPTKGIVKGTVTRADTGAALYNATVTITTATQRSQKTEAHGSYGFFEVDPGTYTVSVTPPNLGSASAQVTVIAGGVFDVDLVVPVTDTTAPVISTVASSSITDTAATITWTTDELSDSTVEYGPTTSYGATATDSAQVTRHSIRLTGLNSSTTYQFRVRSRNPANLEGVSGNYSFTTLAAGNVADIIIDNLGATVAGTWSTGTSSTDKYATDYRYKSLGTGSAYLQYRPDILTAGNYQIYEWHPQGSNRDSGTPHVITYNGGTTTVPVNQQTGGGRWNLLGTFNFVTGTAGYVRITDAITTSGQLALADAIKFVYAAPPPPPAAPSGLTANAVSPTQIDLSWTDNSNNEDNFVVSRSTTPGGPYTDIATLAANTTAYSNSGLPSGTTYYYVVRAVNGTGSSSFSNEAGASTPAVPPNAPSGLTATVVSASQINLGWTDNSNNEDNFVVARSTTAGGPYTDVAILAANATSHSDTGLAAATTYYYVVRAINEIDASPNSNEANATTLQNPPAAPTGLSATAVSSSRIDLSWSDNSANEDGFRIERSTDNVNFSEIVTVGPDSTSYANTGLADGTTYYYRVRAYNNGGNSGYSNSASASTPAQPVTVTFNPVATQDGWVLESTETSNIGGSRKNNATGTAALRVGDDVADKQYKTIVSFDTSSLPDGATILSATLKLKRGTVAGANPFATHGTCHLDIKNGGFGGSAALANSDFEAAADATQVGSMSNPAANGDWSTGVLNSTGVNLINKTGTTQLRVYFATDDNDDLGNDYIGFHGGDDGTVANRPVLEIIYQ